MLLKSLEVQGFKTFPDKTTLSFGNGITAVVGPNGSGKSNISDAIRWVLGEQSSKNIRCAKMEDVIFTGTPLRKAQGFAEVTLSVDNTDRKLPFDSDEVAITRRYYRSGDSEYLINKASVRLRDIHELFMDTGLGRDGYSMISQGKIDSIVASKSEDRREIFEEAAGISKFRYRKAEAQRRLVQSEDNLVRLRDIMVELEDRIGPLAEQSKKAKDYLEFAEEKRELEIGLWLNTLKKSGSMLKEQEEKIAISREQHDCATDELEKIRNESEEIFIKSNSHTAKVDEVRREITQFEENASIKINEASILDNNALHNNSNISRIKNDIEQMNMSAESFEFDIKNKENQIKENEALLQKKDAELLGCTDEINSIKEDMSRFSDLTQGLSSKISDLSIKLSNEKVTSVTCKSSIAEIASRLDNLEASIKTKGEELIEAQKELSDYSSMNNDAQDNVSNLANMAKGYEIQLDSRKKKRDELKKKADELTLTAEERIRRTRLLEELERNLEGFSHSVKIVMKEHNRGTLSGIHGPVSRIIRVPEKYSVAIETALGASMQNIVVGTEDDAKRAISLLKQRDGGRATFLPLTNIKGFALKENGLERSSGFVGIASTLCNCEKQYNNILTSLLGRIVIADSLDNAVLIAKKFDYRFRVVTLDGQVVNTGGSLTGGSLARNSGLLSRAVEIEKLRQEAENLKLESQKARNMLREAETIVSSLEANLLATNSELSIAQEERIKIEAELKSCSSEIEIIKRSLQSMEDEKVTLQKRVSELKSKAEIADKNSADISDSILELESKIEELTGNQEAITDKREQLATKMQEIRLEIFSIKKDIEVLKSEIRTINDRKSDNSDRCKILQEEIDSIIIKNEQIARDIERLKLEAEEEKSKAKMAEGKIEVLNQERMNFEKRSVELRQIERNKTDEIEILGKELARLEERKINMQGEYDAIITKLWEEYELTRREAESISTPIEDIGLAKKRLNELKLKIKNLGSVNVAAIDEYKEVSERYEFMKSQIEDVEKSRQELSKLINDLTSQMKELFITNFNLINTNFALTFKELFGGGSAQLTITDPDDILNSGIDINVQPPGKIVNHLEALSGGERALIAISLYFAIMKVSPAPFCVLDEIEAALDDVNVYRFAAYLRKMNNNTQFIVITHRRGTMEEADVLYGVTMQDEGVSKLLELNVSEIEQKLGIK